MAVYASSDIIFGITVMPSVQTSRNYLNKFFQEAVSKLPTDRYDNEAYSNFICDWGTHIAHGVLVGSLVRASVQCDGAKAVKSDYISAKLSVCRMHACLQLYSLTLCIFRQKQ